MMTLTRHKRLYISLFLSIRMVTFQNSPSVALYVCKWNHKTDCSMSFYQNNKTTCQQNSRTVDHASSHSALIALNQYKKNPLQKLVSQFPDTSLVHVALTQIFAHYPQHHGRSSDLFIYFFKTSVRNGQPSVAMKYKANDRKLILQKL